MTNIPERIWADTEGGWMPHDSSESRRDPCIEYVRADLVTPPQITDAIVEAACAVYWQCAFDSKDNMRAALAAGFGVKP